MKIIAGWNYDGGACPDELGSAEAVEGIVIVGQLGLAGILETRLGLAQADPSQAVRIACYLRTLEGMCVSGDSFFKASFLADGWATAKRLLAERDQLAFSCWNETPCGSPRLDTLAALHAAADCPSGLPDRLAKILEAMQAYGAPGIRRIEMETPCECWPKLWRRIFDAMRQAGVEIADTPSVDQRLLPGECLPRVRPLHAPTLCAAADAVAAWLAANKDNSDALLVVETGGEVLDAALRRHGLPITGATTHSIHRAALQVLPLALELCWSPLSPAALLDFLTVPVCPLHPAMSRWLVRALENHPGTGSPEWSAALDKCRTWGQGRPEGALLVDDLDFWMGLKRYPRGGELDAIVVLTICERLAEWFSTRPPRASSRPAVAGCAYMAPPARERPRSGTGWPSKWTSPCMSGAPQTFCPSGSGDLSRTSRRHSGKQSATKLSYLSMKSTVSSRTDSRQAAPGKSPK